MTSFEKTTPLEKKLLIENKMLQKVLAMIPEHIYWKAKDGTHLGCNLAAAKFFGFDTIDEYIGKNDFDVASVENAKAAVTIDKIVMKTKKSYHVEETITIKNKKKSYLSTKAPMLDDNGNVAGIIGVSIDITDRKRAEALQKELEFEQRANAMLKLWSSAIAHEMRTPLLALKTNTSTLMTLLLSLENDNAEAFKTGRSKRKLAQLKEVPLKLEKTIQHANHFIDMTLVKSRAGNSSVAMQLKPLSIQDEVTDALAKYPLKEADKQLIHVDTKSNFTFMGESDYFHHIIFNLLKNAIHYIKKTDKGKIVIESRAGQK